MKQYPCSILFFLIATSAFSYDTLRTDLLPRRAEPDGRRSLNLDGKVKMINLKLNPPSVGVLEITNNFPFSVFINNQLREKSVTKVYWPMDSLAKTFSLPLMVTIFSDNGLNNCLANIITIGPDTNIKSENYFGDIVAVSSIALFMLFVFLVRTNPSSMREYFNFIKVFSIKSTDEPAALFKINSAGNIMVSLFCASLVAINLFVYFNWMGMATSKEWNGPDQVRFLFQALSITFFVLILKLVVILVSSKLFRLSEFAAGQFYNFVRLLLIGFTLTSTVLLVAYMIGGEFHGLLRFLSYLISSMLLVFVVATFLKLKARGGFTVFHLFSYLCASEIIPCIILLNVFFF